MRVEALKERIAAREHLSGTFVKTPDVSIIEILAGSGLDFAILDAEHSPFGRREIDLCCAIARALDFPLLVRVGAAREDAILQALDAGAVGVVVPHVASPEIAERVARAAHFGPGGRGYAGSTRWAGFATRAMKDVLADDGQTVVIAQIEEPEGVDAVEEIAAQPGLDAVFAGPADLSVGYGQAAIGSPQLDAALERIGIAAQASGKGYATWVSTPEVAAEWAKWGMNIFVLASEHAWMRAGAVAAAKGIKALGD